VGRDVYDLNEALINLSNKTDVVFCPTLGAGGNDIE
jgi:hypothetical protein